MGLCTCDCVYQCSPEKGLGTPKLELHYRDCLLSVLRTELGSSVRPVPVLSPVSSLRSPIEALSGAVYAQACQLRCSHDGFLISS